MRQTLLALLKQLRDMWAALTTAKRLALVAVILTVVLGVLAYSYFSSQKTYAYLFTDLSADDGAAIAAKLKEMKVVYRVAPGGTAIEVPEDKVHELRLELAGAGLPRGGGVGFEIFDKSHLGATEFEQRINLRRALEGELARTIGTIASVQAARVHLVMTEHSVFAIGKQEASASVVLRLRPGRPFGKSEVASVVHLVASAVPGLSAERVSVVSADGLMLHRPTSDAGGTSLGDTEADRERALASGLEEQAKTLLERVVGPGHADVRIGVTLDSAQHDRTEEHYEPSKTALRSEQKSDERSSPEGPTVAGVPGAPSNLPDGTAQQGQGALNGGGAQARTSWTRNWEVDRVTEHTTTPAGRVSRLSVAILVDGNYETADKGRKTFIPRERAELDRLAELVKGAVGYTLERGDFIQIECAAFAGTDLSEPSATPSVLSKRQLMYVAIAAGVLLLLIAIAVFVLVKRSKTKQTTLTAAQVTLTKLAGATAAAVLGGAESVPSLPTAPPDRSALRAQAIEIASRDPATAAIILRGWLGAPSSTAAPRSP
jgi:flagellar M-ring protein FliF